MRIDPEIQLRFEECVDSCADSLFRVAFRLTGNQTLASELVQETYLNAWKSIRTLTDQSKLRSWMFAILRNQYSKLIRNEHRSIATSSELDVLPRKNESESEAADKVQSAFTELDEKHKMPLLLVAMEGMSVDEAATILELPRGTVLSRLHRARQKMKEILIRQDADITRNETSNEI